MTVRDHVLRRVSERRSDAIELCKALIRIPSEDPPGDNRAICSFLETYLKRHDVAGRVYSIDPARPNLVATIDFASPGPRVVFNGHMETLPIGDRSRWSHDPLGGEESGGYLYGRGASCMKGGIAALTIAALVLKEHIETLSGSITLMFVSDEVNGGSRGTGYLLGRVPETSGDVALVGEGGPGINFGHKGPLFVRFTAEGDGGHGALCFARSSAVHRLTDALAAVRQLNGFPVPPPPDIDLHLEVSRGFFDAEYGPLGTDALKQVTVNVGTISGGQKVNMVAESCTADVDFRVPPGMSVDVLLERIRSIVGRYRGVALDVLWANPATVSSPDHAWLQLIQRNSREVLGEALPFLFSHGYTDARFFRLRGVPTAAIGMRGRNVGAPDEHIMADRLLDRARLFALSTYDYLAMRVR